MIEDNILVEIGHIGKPHGLNGEVNLYTDSDIDLNSLSCVVLDMDGINVPFFFNSVRTRGADSYLVTFDGIDREYDAAGLVNKTVYALKQEMSETEQDEEDGFYAEDFIGYKTTINNGTVGGDVIDIDDSTENVLFIIRTDEGKQLYIPVADEFIEDIDVENKLLVFNVPDGILEL